MPDPATPDPPDKISELLSQLGISENTVQKFRFGGIVGKVALVGLGGLGAAVGVVHFTSGWMQIVSLVCVLGVTLLIVRWMFDYASAHPWTATLEGAEVLLWHQQQTVMATAKGVTLVKDAESIPSPLLESTPDTRATDA